MGTEVADFDLYNIGILARDMCPQGPCPRARPSPGSGSYFQLSLLEVTTTFTTRTFTYTIIPGDCPLPLTDVSQDALDCLSRTPGGSICDGGREFRGSMDFEHALGGASVQKPALLR